MPREASRSISFLLEVVAHDRDDSRLSEETGRKSDIGASPSEHAIDFSVWSFHSVVCDGPDYDHGHPFDCTQSAFLSGGSARAFHFDDNSVKLP